MDIAAIRAAAATFARIPDVGFGARIDLGILPVETLHVLCGELGGAIKTHVYAAASTRTAPYAIDAWQATVDGVAMQASGEMRSATEAEAAHLVGLQPGTFAPATTIEAVSK